LLAVGLVAGGYAISGIRLQPETLAVTGSAKERVRADLGEVSGTVSRTVYEQNLSDGYAQIAVDAESVRKALSELGFSAAEITVDPVSANESSVWEDGRFVRTDYTVTARVTAKSSNVAKVARAAESLGQTLAARGVFFQSWGPSYTVSSLPEIRVKLLGEAVADAKRRAESIAENAGATVGPLSSAESGVVQVLAPDSTQVDDYGSYDTSTVEKDVLVTVRAKFSVR
jgi:hypothetical protein